MTEVDVSLTDYILCLEATWFAVAIHASGNKSDLATYLKITFAGFAAASFLGGTSHGFFNTPDSAIYAPLWWSTLFFIGITATGFALAGLALLGTRTMHYGKKVTITALAAYLLATIFYQEFLLAIIFYIPATIVCMTGFFVANRRWTGRGISFGTAGILISLIAPVIQQLQISFHPVYFTYNAVYHVVLMLALFLIFKGSVAALNSKGNIE